MKFVPHFLIVAATFSLATGCSLIKSALASHEKPPAYTLRFYEAVAANLPEANAREVTIAQTQQKFHIDPIPWITEDDVLKAELQPTAAGDAVLVKFDSHGAAKLMEMTTRLRGQHYIIMVNNRAVAAILCERTIANGQFQLLGELTEDETKALVESLNKTANKNRDTGDVRYAP